MAIAARIAAVLVLCLAAISLVGWFVDNEFLKTLIVRANASPMKANTAACLILIAIGFYLQIRIDKPTPGAASRYVSDVLVFAALAVTGLTLAEHLFSVNFGIDQMIVTDHSPAPDKHPGRMSIATASCLLLLAVSVVLIDRVHWLSRLCVVLAGTSAYLGLCSYIYGVDALKPVSLYSTMAVHTAVSLVLLAIAHFLAIPQRRPTDLLGSEYFGGKFARRFLPITLLVTPFIGYLRLKGQHWGYYGTEFGLALFAVANVLTLTCLVWWQASQLDRADIRRRQLEEDREALLARAQAAREKAERASRTKDQLLSVVSHELRTPLTPALLLVRSLENHKDLPEDARHDLQTIREQITIEVQLISDLLDLAGIETGRLRLDRTPQDLGKVIHDMTHILRPSFVEAGIQLSVNVGTSPVIAQVDRNRVGQVIRNLLDNAAKFTPRGGSVSVKLSAENADFAEVTISDTGIGIEPHQLDKVFHAFTQSDSSITRRFGGLGIGLTIAHDIVQAHGGTIRASSEGLGKGATFTFTLPRSRAPVAPAGQETTPSSPDNSKSAALKLLVVDDNPQTLNVMARLLRSEGHEVTPVPDAREALAAVAAQPFDLIICDIGLPDMDGWTLMRKLKECHPKIRGLAISGFVSMEDATRSTEAGFEMHLPKPLDINQLTQALYSMRN